MPNATVTVKYVNPPKPGKKKGSIKTDDGIMFGVWNASMDQFEAGKTYDIEFAEQDLGGVIYRTVKTVRPRIATAAIATNSSPPTTQTDNNNGFYKETCAKDSERMWVCSLMNAFIQSGQLTLDPQQLASTTKMLRGLWQHTFGSDNQGQLSSMNGSSRVA